MPGHDAKYESVLCNTDEILNYYFFHLDKQ